MAEQVDHLATPALGRGAVDEERVLDAAVDRLGVRAEYAQSGEVRR